MKKLQSILLGAILLLSVSCQSGKETIAPQTTDAASGVDVAYIAKNYYKQLPQDEMVRVAEAYRSMNYEQMTAYIDARYQINLAEGMDAGRAALLRDLRHRTNKEVFTKTGHSYASADQDVSAAVFSAFSQLDTYAALRSENAQGPGKGARVAAASCPNGNWYQTKSTPWYNYLSGTAWEIQFWGRFNYNGNSNDCDYVFRSRRYNIYYKTTHIWAMVAASRNVLSYGGSTSNPAKEPAINSTEAVFEFLVGKGRVDLEYFGESGNSYDLFTYDTRINLMPR
ncbi:MAG: hypothetical protein ICV83_29535 [Cytophagales bacterium]|nr:hypothetical protein [Cytophagales bacterium]